MSQPDDASQTSSAASDGPPKTNDPLGDQAAPGAPETASASSTRSWSIILAAGLAAGFIAFGIGEVAPILVPVSLEVPMEVRKDRSALPQVIQGRIMISRDRAAALAYGGLGMVLGLALGVAGGLIRRSPRAAIAAGFIGMVLGGAGGAGATLGLLPSFHATRAAASDEEWNNDLLLALRTHGGIWVTVGAAAGLALGLGIGGTARTVRAIIGGMLGAALGTIIYEFIGALAFAVAETFRPTAVTPTPRLLAHFAVALCVSVMAFWFAEYLQVHRRARRAQA
jgi:hypothetical protein